MGNDTQLLFDLPATRRKTVTFNFDSRPEHVGRRCGSFAQGDTPLRAGVHHHHHPYLNRASSTCRWIFPDVLLGRSSIATKWTSLGSL